MEGVDVMCTTVYPIHPPLMDSRAALLYELGYLVLCKEDGGMCTIIMWGWHMIRNHLKIIRKWFSILHRDHEML